MELIAAYSQIIPERDTLIPAEGQTWVDYNPNNNRYDILIMTNGDWEPKTGYTLTKQQLVNIRNQIDEII